MSQEENREKDIKDIKTKNIGKSQSEKREEGNKEDLRRWVVKTISLSGEGRGKINEREARNKVSTQKTKEKLIRNI